MYTEQQRASFEAWAQRIGFAVKGKFAETSQVICSKEAFLAGYQAALESPQVQDLKDSLQSILYDMENEGRGTGYEYQNAQAVLAAMEKQK